jgi:hypothetical protein
LSYGISVALFLPVRILHFALGELGKGKMGKGGKWEKRQMGKGGNGKRVKWEKVKRRKGGKDKNGNA